MDVSCGPSSSALASGSRRPGRCERPSPCWDGRSRGDGNACAVGDPPAPPGAWADCISPAQQGNSTGRGPPVSPGRVSTPFLFTRNSPTSRRLSNVSVLESVVLTLLRGSSGADRWTLDKQQRGNKSAPPGAAAILGASHAQVPCSPRAVSSFLELQERDFLGWKNHRTTSCSLPISRHCPCVSSLEGLLAPTPTSGLGVLGGRGHTCAVCTCVGCRGSRRQET